MDADRYSELLLRFEKPRQAGGPYPVEAMVDGAGLWTGGEIALDWMALEDAPNPAEYGARLWKTLADGWREFPAIFSKAWGLGGQKVRLRLMLDLDSPDLHRIKWEFLRPEGDADPAGVNILRPVSRFLPLASLPEVTEGARLNILLAIASPTDLQPPLFRIDSNAEILSLARALEPRIREGQVTLAVLAGSPQLSDETRRLLDSLKAELIGKATTAGAIAEALEGRHVLHLIAHGDFRKQPVLLLEDDAGGRKPSDRDEILTRWSAAQPRLIFLQSCRSDPEDRSWPAPGFGPLFVQRGAPAVVAMRDYVEMDAAREFAAAFYRALLATGEVDVAANAGRARIFRSKNGDWAIPVLYSRLRAGDRLWTPDPLRQSIQALATRLGEMREVRRPFPVEVTVVKDVEAAPRELEQPSSETRVDALATATQELASTAQITELIVLLGGRGRAKSALLRKLFADLAAATALSGGACPLLIRLADCDQSPDPTAAISAAWAKSLDDYNVAYDGRALHEQLRKCGVRLLVDGDDDAGPGELPALLDRVKQFLKGNDRSALVTMDESTFVPGMFDRERTTVLMVQDLRPDTLRGFLETYRSSEEDGAGLPADLQAALTGPFRDMAGIPWLLSRILELAALDPGIVKSRFLVLDRIMRDRLALMSVPPGGRGLARAAMQEMAWRLHSRRARDLSLEETYELLEGARGTRDFRLDDFRAKLLDCRLLVTSGAEGVRFAYAGAHAYFTACYLNALEPADLEERLRGIVAGLGNLERLRMWREVLLLLSGHMRAPDRLIGLLLDAGYGEGEHLLLAARCIHEARSAGKSVDPGLAARLTDSLIWWSSYRSGLAPRSRLHAVEAFGYLLGGGPKPKNAERVVHHILHLVLDRMRPDASGEAQLDYSDVRLEALSLLFQHQDLVLPQLQDPHFDECPREEVLRLIGVWTAGNLEALAACLSDPGADDPKAADHRAKALLAGLAAFAMVTMGSKAAIDMLVNRFMRLPVNADLHWLIADGLIKLQARAAMDLVRRAVDSPELVDPSLTHHVVYAIGKLGSAMAEPKQLRYLDGCLKSPDVYLEGRSLRAYAEILGSMQDPRIDDLRAVCHDVLRRKFAGALRRLGGPVRHLRPFERTLLTSYALEALGHIGNQRSLEILREFSLQPVSFRASQQDERLRKTSWEVSERIRLRISDRVSAS